MDWQIERVIHFEPGDFVKSRYAHFGFHDKHDHYYGIAHQKHYLAAVGADGNLLWTLSAQPVFSGVANIEADLRFPMYIDSLPDGSLVVSNFGNSHLYRVDTNSMQATLLINGSDLGMTDMGNCVVDRKGNIWVNEVTGCRIWTFDSAGRTLQVFGDGRPGFQVERAEFEHARFNWIYDIRLGPDGNLYVLDSKNYALRMINPIEKCVITLAGTGEPGYSGDGADARAATFGSDPAARFDGPISLSLDAVGNIYIGDRFNCVVRMIDRTSGIISTIAGHRAVGGQDPTDPIEKDPLRANLPQISSMNYHRGNLFVPTDLGPETGDLVILKKVL